MRPTIWPQASLPGRSRFKIRANGRGRHSGTQDHSKSARPACNFMTISELLAIVVIAQPAIGSSRATPKSMIGNSRGFDRRTALSLAQYRWLHPPARLGPTNHVGGPYRLTTIRKKAKASGARAGHSGKPATASGGENSEYIANYRDQYTRGVFHVISRLLQKRQNLVRRVAEIADRPKGGCAAWIKRRTDAQRHPVKDGFCGKGNAGVHQ
jgi:hypothetical protein